MPRVAGAVYLDGKEIRIMLWLLPGVGPVFWLLKVIFGALALVPIVGPFFAMLALIF